MQQKNILLEQLSACHNQNGWFVSLKSALNGLTEDYADWKSSEDSNSIRENVNHLLFWNERYLGRFNGIPEVEMVGNNDTTFRNQEELSWSGTVEKLNRIFEEWAAAIRECDESKFISPTTTQNDSPWSTTLSHITIHNAYHIGQIVQIRKLQGSWDSKQGVH
jgi:uncharacterized damage-inducible protein DinB